MSLKGIIAISGMPGLFKVLAQTKSGFIVEALADKKRMPVSSSQRISMLEDISVYTHTDDLPLKDVMMKMLDYSQNNSILDPKSSPDNLKDFFKLVIPDFDTERVYASDIKKMISWFHMVKDFVAVEDEPEKTETETNTEETAEIVAEEKPKKAKVKAAVESDENSDTKVVAKKKPAAKAKKKED